MQTDSSARSGHRYQPSLESGHGPEGGALSRTKKVRPCVLLARSPGATFSRADRDTLDAFNLSQASLADALPGSPSCRPLCGLGQTQSRSR